MSWKERLADSRRARRDGWLLPVLTPTRFSNHAPDVTAELSEKRSSRDDARRVALPARAAFAACANGVERFHDARARGACHSIADRATRRHRAHRLPRR